MHSARGLDDLERPTYNTNTNFEEPLETQLESAIFDPSSRFIPEIACNLNWHSREDYTNATAFSSSTVGIEAPYVFQEHGNGWSALPFQGGYMPDNLSVDDMPPLVNRTIAADGYEVDVPYSPTSTLNQNIPPSSPSHTGSFGSPTMSKSNGASEKKPQDKRCARRKAEQGYRGRKQHAANEIRNLLQRRGFKVEAAWFNALTLLDICKRQEIQALRCRCK